MLVVVSRWWPRAPTLSPAKNEYHFTVSLTHLIYPHQYILYSNHYCQFKKQKLKYYFVPTSVLLYFCLNILKHLIRDSQRISNYNNNN